MDNSKTLMEMMEGCEALRGKTIQDILDSDEFLSRLGRYWEYQKKERELARETARMMGGNKRIPSHVIDKLMGWNARDLAREYGYIISKVSSLPAAPRKYIYQLGRQAYNLTILDMYVAEHPEDGERVEALINGRRLGDG